MEPHTLRTIIVGIVVFSIFGGVPLIIALLSHQQKMAALFAKNSLDSSELKARLDLMERKLSVLQQPDRSPESLRPISADGLDEVSPDQKPSRQFS